MSGILNNQPTVSQSGAPQAPMNHQPALNPTGLTTSTTSTTSKPSKEMNRDLGTSYHTTNDSLLNKASVTDSSLGSSSIHRSSHTSSSLPTSSSSKPSSVVAKPTIGDTSLNNASSINSATLNTAQMAKPLLSSPSSVPEAPKENSLHSSSKEHNLSHASMNRPTNHHSSAAASSSSDSHLGESALNHSIWKDSSANSTTAAPAIAASSSKKSSSTSDSMLNKQSSSGSLNQSNLHSSSLNNSVSSMHSSSMHSSSLGSSADQSAISATNPYGATTNSTSARTAYTGMTTQDRSLTDQRSGLSGDDAMTRSEEQLHVEKTSVPSGVAALDKTVSVEHVEQAIPVQRERVIIEREPITAQNFPAAMAGPEISEAHYETVLREERVAAIKETVPVERIRLAKHLETTIESVGADLRKEHIDLTTHSIDGKADLMAFSYGQSDSIVNDKIDSRAGSALTNESLNTRDSRIANNTNTRNV